MPRLSLGLGVQNIRKVGGAAALITTSRAFNSSNVQVGSTNTGDIPSSWLEGESTVTSVIFANDNSVTSIGDYAFRECYSLTSITIPNGVTSIGFYAFKDCTALSSVTFAPTSSVTNIANYAFSNTALTSITIPNSVTSIGSYAFYNCTSLATATIGTGVITIGDGAFDHGNLISITIPNNVTGIGEQAFRANASLATVLCYVAQSAFTSVNAFLGTASPLTIRARSTDASWTAGTGLSFQGNTNVTVIKNL